MKVENTSYLSDDRNYESSPKRDGNYKMVDQESSPRQTYTRDNQERYKKSHYSNVPFDYKQIDNVKQSLWHRKPCTFCGLNNHVATKCWKRMDLYMKVIETRKKPKHEDPTPPITKRVDIRKPHVGHSIQSYIPSNVIFKPLK